MFAVFPPPSRGGVAKGGEVRCVGVTVRGVALAWPLIEGWVAEALQRGKADQTPDDILRFLQAGSAQLWLAWPAGGRARGCCVTELVEGARGRTCGLVVVGGEGFDDWRAALEPIKAWARAQGCVRLEASGRAGWERKLAADGWRKIRTTIEVVL